MRFKTELKKNKWGSFNIPVEWCRVFPSHSPWRMCLAIKGSKEKLSQEAAEEKSFWLWITGDSEKWAASRWAAHRIDQPCGPTAQSKYKEGSKRLRTCRTWLRILVTSAVMLRRYAEGEYMWEVYLNNVKTDYCIFPEIDAQGQVVALF